MYFMKDEYTNNSYEELCELSEDINDRLAQDVQAVYNPDKASRKRKVEVSYDDPKRLEKPLEVDKYNIGECVLIFGINPSSSDIDSSEHKKPVFLQCMDKEEFNDQPKGIRKYAYNTYFSPGYKLFKDFGYNLLWRNNDYLEDCIKNIKEMKDIEDIKEIHKEYLRSKTLQNDKYLIFADLVYFKETNSKYMQEALLKYRNEVFKLFEMQVNYYKPKLILVANAFASKLLLACIQKCEYNHIEPKTCEYIDIEPTKCGKVSKVPIVFSAMLSNGNTDNFSLIRLKREIEELMKPNKETNL